MISKIIGLAVAAGCFFLSSCAEFQNRGGTIDWLEDRLVFRADTKSHRLIRSYILVGGLARLATSSPLTAEERVQFARRMNIALDQAHEAFLCTKRDESQTTVDSCSFFDDRMAALDRSILALARAIFVPAENAELLKAIQNEMIGGDLTDIFSAPAKVAEAAAVTAKTAATSIDAVSAILKLGRNAFRMGTRLGPIYRDSVELDLKIVRSSLKRQCAPRQNIAASRDPCQDLTRVEDLYRSAPANVGQWAVLMRELHLAYAGLIEPDPIHFAEVSELIWRACDSLGLVKPASASADPLLECRGYSKAGAPTNRLLFGAQVMKWRETTNAGATGLAEAR